MKEPGDVCPKCGKPRFEDAIDCPFCGIVFARYEGGAPAPPPEPQPTPPGPPPAAGPFSAPAPGEPADPPTAGPPAAGPPGAAPDDVYQGPLPGEPGPDGLYQGPDLLDVPSPLGSVSSDPTAGRFQPLKPQRQVPQSRIGELINRDLGLSLLVVAGFYLFAQIVLNVQIVGGTTDVDAVRGRFLDLSGLEAPPELDNAGYVRFVGRDFVWFTRVSAGFPEVVMLVRHRTLGGWKEGAELRERVKGFMTDLGMEWEESESERARVINNDAEVELLRFGRGLRSTGTVALVTYEPDDRPTLLVLAAPRREFGDLRKEYLRRAR